MSNELIFSISNGLAIIGWLFLLIAPYWKWTGRIVIGGVVSLLAVLYVSFIVQSFGGESSGGDFNSLAGVMELFTKEIAVLAGWLHYLAFDLIVGWFIVNNAKKHEVNRWLIIPCLLLTFILGPSGLLLYLIIRFLKTGNYIADNR